MSGYVGFKSASQTEEPAWFHNAQSAINFANACGWENEDGEKLTESDLDETYDANDSDILDEPDLIWTPNGLIAK